MGTSSTLSDPSMFYFLEDQQKCAAGKVVLKIFLTSSPLLLKQFFFLLFSFFFFFPRYGSTKICRCVSSSLNFLVCGVYCELFLCISNLHVVKLGSMEYFPPFFFLLAFLQSLRRTTKGYKIVELLTQVLEHQKVMKILKNYLMVVII